MCVTCACAIRSRLVALPLFLVHIFNIILSIEGTESPSSSSREHTHTRTQKKRKQNMGSGFAGFTSEYGGELRRGSTVCMCVGLMECG